MQRNNKKQQCLYTHPVDTLGGCVAPRARLADAADAVVAEAVGGRVTIVASTHSKQVYWKWNFHMNPHVRVLVVGWSVVGWSIGRSVSYNFLQTQSSYIFQPYPFVALIGSANPL